MYRPLTVKQQRVLNEIKEFAKQHHYMPTYVELAQSLGYRSTNSIQKHFRVLKHKGYLDIDAYKWRGARLRGDETDTQEVPLVGRVACGTPVLAEENIEDWFPVDSRLIGRNPENFYFLQASGDSMDLAGIEDGDLLLVEREVQARVGDAVVALIDDEATVKFYKSGTGFVALLPKSSNPQHKPIIVAEAFTILGVVRKVVRQQDLRL